ncbi:MAG: ATP-binding protein [Thermoanaerobaculia bacterium]
MPNRFSDKKYILPFGRYVGTSEVEPPADEVLVGREVQRAYLVDLLISMGRRGAYLVTGRRGTGKTSFVRYCISEYRASVFSRFLRNNVGRGVWDRLLVLFFWLAILAGALATSEAAQAFVLSQTAGNMDMPALILLIPAGVLLLYPCVYAKVAVEAILRYRSELKPRPPDHASGVLAFGAVFVASLLAWLSPLGNRPAIAAALFIPACGALYATVQAISYESTRRNRRGTRRRALGLFLLAVASTTGIALSGSLRGSDMVHAMFVPGPYPLFPTNDEMWRLLLLCVELGAILIGSGLCFRGFDQQRRVRLVRGVDALSEGLKRAIESGSAWYCRIGAPLLALGAFSLGVQILSLGLAEPGYPLAVSLGGFALFLVLLIVTGSQARRVDETEDAGEEPSAIFRPRPTWVLGGKSLLSITVALQLAYPALSHFEGWALRTRTWSWCSAGSSLCQASLSRAPLFAGRTDEQCWLIALLIAIGTIFFLEYEWIMRPYVRTREDRAFGAGELAPWEDWEDESDVVPIGRRRRVYLSLAELTLPWATYKAWLPVMSVAVNLGFDRLDHRHVIQAMLVGLRERYHRAFHAWNSGFANLGRFIGILMILVLVSLISRQLPPPACSSPALDGPLTEGRFWLNLVQQTQCFPLPSGISSHLLLLDLLPHTAPTAFSPTVYFSVYHALLFVLLFILTQWALRRVPVLPYKENLRRMDDLLDSLSARTKVTSSLNLWGPARWIYSMFSDDRTKETERDPLDPRTVELAFLQILEDVQKGGFRFPGAARYHLTLPAPEITFIFDELDKLGTRFDPTEEVRDGSLPKQEIQAIYSERERSLRLRSLLSDLKNILASAPARFIFVGGRDLHDEWLADQTSRLPLLTSIFNAEVYLPSLFTDRGDNGAPSLHDRVKEYFLRQYDRALSLYYRSVRKRWLPSFGLSVEAISQERFATAGESLSHPLVFDLQTRKYLEAGEQKALLEDFVLFLTHRSMGNPKKLKDLLASFIRSAGREHRERSLRQEFPPVRHVILLEQTDLFRIGLMVGIYRHLTQAFEQRMVRRDDKYAVSIFFLTDFLFKFHRRAFSWSNLERVDDLAHIHRLPDLREIQEEIVDHFSERFLHRVMNGIYAFRFRSDIAREVEYLSRQSPPEMAALNFTLDESLSLKSVYREAIEGGERKNPDLIAALGELYEFDQDFEETRHQYRVAIKILDRNLGVGGDVKETVYRVLNGEGGNEARIFLPWGVARMRLMLQIGMSFELERDLERAQAEYRSARTLARALVHAYVDAVGRGEVAVEEEGLSGEGSRRSSKKVARIHSLKHMNILSQPMFAEAWLAEKFVSAVDASVTLIERGLWEIRRSLPFVRSPKLNKDEYPSTDVVGAFSNFSLTLSQLHNKAGDLFFFKGRQPAILANIKLSLKEEPPSSDSQTDGYVLRAHYHYAVSLHDLRRYVFHRIMRSDWLSLASTKTFTLLTQALPDYLFRAVASNVNDMAEATLARISLFKMFHELKEADPGVRPAPGAAEALKARVLRWLGSGDDESRSSDLKDWFGPWKEHEEYGEARLDLLDFTGPNPACERLSMSLDLCIVGAGFFEDGGYPEDAGRELLQVCETVTRYLWWGLILEKIGGLPTGVSGLEGLPVTGLFESGPAKEFWNGLIDITIKSLKKADRLFRQSRRYASGAEEGKEREEKKYLVGTMIPTEALTILCSLGLALDALSVPKTDSRRSGLVDLMGSWGITGDDFDAALSSAIQRHAYPVINRLRGIKVLIDSLVWRSWSHPEARDEFKNALGWTSSLLDLSEQFNSPLHFTPLHSGMTCALVWLWSLKRPAGEEVETEIALEEIYRAAQRDLYNSEEMYTMQRSYYKAISGLYYLYDDFNDRQIHYNHALQMAGAELNTVLRHLVDHREKVEKALRPSVSG